jgi:sugar lactone lactonase YvrE
VNQLRRRRAALVASLLIAACAGQAQPAPAAATPGAGAWQKVLTAEGEVVGVAVDGQGNIYVAEVDKDQIEKFGRDGKRLARWGQTGSGPGQLSRPAKVTVDALGNVYVTILTTVLNTEAYRLPWASRAISV